MIHVDAHALAASEKVGLGASNGQNCDAENCVGGSVHNYYLSKNGTKVGVVGPVKSCFIFVDDMKGSLPALGD